MFKIFLCLVILGTALADDWDDDRFDDSREIHFVGGSPILKTVGVPLPYSFKNVPAVKTASDVEVVHVDQQVGPNPSKVGTSFGHQGMVGNFHAPFFVKVDDDDDDDDDDKVYYRRPGVAPVPLTYSAGGSYKFKFDDDDDDDDDKKYFFRSVGVPLPYSAGYKFGDDRKVIFKSAATAGAPTKYAYSVGYKVDDDDDDKRFFFRTGHPSPITYSARYKYDDDDDDIFDWDDK